MTGFETVSAIVAVVGSIILILEYKDKKKKPADPMQVTANSISTYYHKDLELSALLHNIRDLDASQVALLMDKLEQIILERNGREMEARLLLDYFKAEYLE